MAELRILPPAAKYFKKLKDKQLKRLFQEAIDEILEDPSVGEEKKGDLKGIKGYDIFYNHTNYELAYTVEYVKRNNSDAVDVDRKSTRLNSSHPTTSRMPSCA